MLTPAQQGLFRPLVERAWQSHCRLQGLPAGDKTARREWYETQLLEACEVRSSSDLDPKRDFEAAMEHFEALVGDSIYWAMRRHGGDARRIAWQIRDLCRAHDIDERYMRGIARQALRLGADAPLPELLTLAPADLVTIIRALRIHLRRVASR